MNLTGGDYRTKSPVLLVIFRRIDTTMQVFQQIKCAKPPRLYIAADGPRPNKPGEDIQCTEVRNMVLKAIDWECEVHLLFREHNLGCKEAVSSALDWFFAHEEEGIILEDDCLPANSFFMFCDNLLERYRFDTRIWLISGCNFQNGKKYGNASYYFSNLTNGWGWASWRRSWSLYDKELTGYNETEVRAQLEKIFRHKMIVDRWEELFRETKAGRIDTWDYQVTFTHFFNNCINIVPNYNLVSNIGFGAGASKTLNADSVFANLPLEEINEIIHPKYILPETEADISVLFEEFGIPEKIAQLKKYNSPKKRFKRWSKSLFSRSYSSVAAVILR